MHFNHETGDRFPGISGPKKSGRSAHLTIESFQGASGTKFQLVPYKGAGQSISDLIGGSVDALMGSVATVTGHIKGGRVRPLSVTGTKRVDSMPDVPTIAESGYRGFDSVTWFGLLAPAGTPPAIVERLNQEVNKILVLPEVKEKLEADGDRPIGGTSQEFVRFLASEFQKWSKVVKDSGARPD